MVQACPSRTAQTSHGADTFIKQLVSRLYEQMLIDKAYSVLVPTMKDNKKPRRMLEMPNCAIKRSTKNCFWINGRLKKHRHQNIELDSHILDWFCGNHNKVVIRKTNIAMYAQLYLEDYMVTSKERCKVELPAKWMTPSSEAFTILCLENYYNNIQDIADNSSKVHKPLWTAKGLGAKRNQGWTTCILL
jgi:hypothetical protein